MLVYFDTNIFDHIYKKAAGITEAQVDVLKEAVRTGKISIIFSLQAIEETLAILNRTPTIPLAEIDLILTLSDWTKVIKEPREILNETVADFVNGNDTSAFYPFAESTFLIYQILRPLIFQTPENISDLYKVVAESLSRKQSFMKDDSFAKAYDLPLMQKLFNNETPTFEGFFNLLATYQVTDLLDAHWMRKHGRISDIEGLLKKRPILLFTGNLLSQYYARMFEQAGSHMGDQVDFLQVVSASVADVFVCHDRKLRNRLRRVPIPGFQVLTLQELLGQL